MSPSYTRFFVRQKESRGNKKTKGISIFFLLHSPIFGFALVYFFDFSLHDSQATRKEKNQILQLLSCLKPVENNHAIRGLGLSVLLLSDELLEVVNIITVKPSEAYPSRLH